MKIFVLIAEWGYHSDQGTLIVYVGTEPLTQDEIAKVLAPHRLPAENFSLSRQVWGDGKFIGDSW